VVEHDSDLIRRSGGPSTRLSASRIAATGHSMPARSIRQSSVIEKSVKVKVAVRPPVETISTP
jgi:hypothetical protein